MDDKMYIEFLKKHVKSLMEIIHSYEAMFGSLEKTTEEIKEGLENV